MNEYRDEEALIRLAIEELPMSNEMPQNLKSKLTDKALDAKRKAQPSRRPWLVGVMTAGLACLAMAAFFMIPKPALGRSWSLIKEAVQQVKTFQIEITDDTEGKSQTVRVATAGNKLKVETGGDGIVFMDGATIQIYDQKENKVTRLKIPTDAVGAFIPDMIAEAFKSFDLKKEFDEYEKKYGKDHIRLSPIRDREGREVYDVLMTSPEGGGKIEMTIDASSNLPTDIRTTDVTNGKTHQAIITLRYNDSINIEPNFPAGVKFEDVDMGEIGKAMGKGELKMDIGKAFESFGKGHDPLAGK